MLVKYGCLSRNWLQGFGVSKRRCKKHDIEKAVNDEINLAISRFQKVEDWFNKGKTCLSISIIKNENNEPDC